MSTTRNLLNGGIDADVFNVILNNVKPSDVISGKKIPDITKWRFCDVMGFGKSDLIQASFLVLERYAGMDEESVLKTKASEYMSVLRFIKDGFDKVANLFSQLESDPDVDMISAGIDKMDRFGVVGIYYGIDENPANWDAISEVPFEKMYVKLMIDKTRAEIQRAYQSIQSNKNKRK